MNVWCRGAVACALLLTVGMTRPSHGAADQPVGREPGASVDVWAQRAQRFAELWSGDQRTQAEQEMLAEGRDAAATGLQRVVKELPATDPRHLQAGFALYVLDLDRALGRSVLVAACRPGRRPNPLYTAFHLAVPAYYHRPDRQLLSAVLRLAPDAGGGATRSMLSFIISAATEHTRDLLLVLQDEPVPVRRSVATDLTWQVDGRPARRAYPEVARIAAQTSDPLYSDAQRLLTDIDEAEKQVQMVHAQIRRLQAQQFPLVPKGVTLPGSAVKALRSSYPRWHVMGTSGFAPEVVAFVQKHFGKAATPQHCSGDFDGNGLRDEALLIRENGGEGVKFIVLRQVKAGRWKAYELASSPLPGGTQGGYSGFSIYITPRAPGTIAYWTDQGKTGRLRLKHDGVEWNFWGKTSMLYYWNGSAWASVQTGD